MKRVDPLTLPLDGLQLIEASAGTGKTHTITTLFLRLLLEKRLRVDQILVVTFTKAATAELRDRVRGRLRQACLAFERGEGEAEVGELVAKSSDRAADRQRLEDALRAFDQAAIFTIHGFCQRALSEHAFESGQPFELELVTDQRVYLRELAEDYFAEQLSGTDEARLAHVRTARVSLERWIRLAAVAAAAPDVELRPRPRATDVPGAVQRYLDARAAAARAWPSARAEVEHLLIDSGVLKQNTHKPEKIRQWLEELDALLARADATLRGLPSTLEKLSPAALESATRKAARPPRHSFFELVQRVDETGKAARAELDAWVLSLEHGLVARVRSELSRRKSALGVQSFDDLLNQLALALAGRRGEALSRQLIERFPAALVDEFQDTDPTQYEIFRRIYLGRRGSLFLIGDPKQAIYAFRGADIFSYLAAARDAGEATWTLATNHRSDPSLVSAVNTLFVRAERPFVLDGIEFSPVDSRPGSEDVLSRHDGSATRLEVAVVAWEPGAGKEGKRITKDWAALPGRIAAHVAELLHSGSHLGSRELEPGDVAVLTRTNKQAFDVQAELRRLGIPSVLLGDQSVLDSAEAQELALILTALWAPTQERALLSALSTSLFGLSAAELARLRDDEAAWERRVEAFRSWQMLWVRHGLVRAFRALLRDERAVERVLSLPDGDRRLTNFLHLTELLQRVSSSEHLGIAGLRRWFDEARFDPVKRSEMAPDAQQLRLESDEDAVKLTTMHKSKGLEYPVVFCPYLWDGTHVGRDEVVVTYHDPDAGLAPRLHLGTPAQDQPEYALLERERRAENMRLCYVALTRARHRTSVVWGPFRTADSAPLAALLHSSAGAHDGRAPGERVHLLDAEGLKQDLGRLVASAPNCFEVSELARSAAPWRAAETGAKQLEARSITRRLDAAWRSASFSALVSEGRAVSLPAALGRDVDEGTSQPPFGAVEASRDPVVLHAFPRGARSGDALHELLEHIDFQDGSREVLATAVLATLTRHGIDTSHVDVVCRAIEDVLDTPLDDRQPHLRLRNVGMDARISELEFTFPVAAPGGIRLSAADLAAVFRRFPDELALGYVERLAALGFQPLEGYLRGFIDLVMCHEGRYWVVDYKSNFLGPRPADYAPERLEQEMARHHYLLQAHLYSVAVHRFLEARKQDYVYERDFAGVLYLFLRGMSPARGASTGVHFHRPPEGRIRALSELLAGQRRTGAS